MEYVSFIYLYSRAIYSCSAANMLLKDWILFDYKAQWVIRFTATYYCKVSSAFKPEEMTKCFLGRNECLSKLQTKSTQAPQISFFPNIPLRYITAKQQKYI